MLSSNDLSQIIAKKIQAEGPITFKDFMEMALYHPYFGYYNTNQNIIGSKGDFYTSPSLTPAFGAMIARQIEEMWRLMDKHDFTIVEYGAGTGTLCLDILAYLKKLPELYDRLSYVIIEKSIILKKHQQRHLPEKVKWVDNIKELFVVSGCILTNEVIDNFSVHQVVMEDQLMEIYVTENGDFEEVLRPANKMLSNYLDRQGIVLPKGFRTEINLEAEEWLKDISYVLKKGFVITIDYGHTTTKLYNEYRQHGTLVCYKKHQINDNPYLNIGSQDITAHVNFSALCKCGLMFGLDNHGIVSQREFLISLGFKKYLEELMQPDGNDLIKIMRQHAFITYQLLIEMGSKFLVLIQSKGMGQLQLLGLKALTVSEGVLL